MPGTCSSPLVKRFEEMGGAGGGSEHGTGSPLGSDKLEDASFLS